MNRGLIVDLFIGTKCLLTHLVLNKLNWQSHKAWRLNYSCYL